MAQVLLCKQYNFGEKTDYNYRDIEFFLGVYFFGAPCIHVKIKLKQCRDI